MIKYDIRTGITKIKTKAATIASVAVLGISGLGMAVVVPAVSNAAGDPPGYYGNPGRQQAIDVGAQCDSGAGSGAFGYFGNYGYVHDLGVNNPGSNGVPGADGHQTGLNNSAVCGNRQGNLTP